MPIGLLPDLTDTAETNPVSEHAVSHTGTQRSRFRARPGSVSGRRRSSVQNLGGLVCASEVAPASWSAALLCRFLDGTERWENVGYLRAFGSPSQSRTGAQHSKTWRNPYTPGSRGWATAVATLYTILLSFGAYAQPTPLVRAHAHNDYEHKRPLLDSLDHGFCSVEADIYQIDGRLLVAHNRADVKPERTLQALYLDPLRDRLRENGGRVYTNGPEFSLLIDIKDRWRTTYPALRKLLENYTDILTKWEAGKLQPGAIRGIISGNRAREMFEGETVRYAAFDGELADLETNASPDLIPWISSSWRPTFTWAGSGPLPAEQQKKLKEIVTKAHNQNRRVRFWGAPDNEAFWRELLANDVDLINTDNLAGLQAFLEGPKK